MENRAKRKIVFSFVFLFLFFFIFLVSASSYVACPDDNEEDIENVPCEGITRAYVNCSGNATVMYLNNESQNYSIYLYEKNTINNTCNFTFPYTSIGDYFISVPTISGTNDTAILRVGNLDEDYEDKWLYYYGSILGLATFLFILGYKSENYLLTLLAGFLVMGFAVFFVKEGYPTLVDNTMRLSIILVSSGIGLYITGSSALGLIREGL